jgi:hypothetical protein
MSTPLISAYHATVVLCGAIIGSFALYGLLESIAALQRYRVRRAQRRKFNALYREIIRANPAPDARNKILEFKRRVSR